MSDMIFRYLREYGLEQGRAVGPPMTTLKPNARICIADSWAGAGTTRGPHGMRGQAR
jgi:hypothetical protein